MLLPETANFTFLHPCDGGSVSFFSGLLRWGARCRVPTPCSSAINVFLWKLLLPTPVDLRFYWADCVTSSGKQTWYRREGHAHSGRLSRAVVQQCATNRGSSSEGCCCKSKRNGGVGRACGRLADNKPNELGLPFSTITTTQTIRKNIIHCIHYSSQTMLKNHSRTLPRNIASCPAKAPSTLFAQWIFVPCSASHFVRQQNNKDGHLQPALRPRKRAKQHSLALDLPRWTRTS
jgi:hypothetical protein